MTTKAPTHHVSDEQLVEYASGACSEAAALAIACHLSLCATCASNGRALEAVGGASLEASPAQPLAGGALNRMLARLDDEGAPDGAVALDPQIGGLLAGWRVPRAVAPYLPPGVAAAGWRRLVPGVTCVDLHVGPSSTVARLVSLSPGIEVPLHEHGGTEYTVIFTGSLVDDEGRFARGDVSIREPGARHVQRVDAGEPCVALVVNEGPLVPLTLKGKILGFLLRR